MADFDALNKFFLHKTFISGERLSVADLAFVSALKQLYDKTVIDPKSRAEFRNFNRYYNTIINQPDFENVKNLELFKSKPKAAESSASASADLMEALEKAQAKPKDPFAVLPATTFDFDAFKRTYSNNGPSVYLPYFWKEFDPVNCSIWKCDYKYNSELNLAFMSYNLVGGILQRLDKARKQSFGSLAVYGADKDNLIAGLWVWRGQDLMFKLSDDWQVDYESFDWEKLDPAADETKKLVELFFNQDENSEYNGKKLSDGKIFK